MAGFFFDTSGILKRHVTETGSHWVSSLVDPAAGNRVHVARITGVETIAAITRRERSGNLSAAEAATALGQFRLAFATSYRITEITPALVDHAMNLAETHGLRGYDAVQLAAALDVKAQYLALGEILTLVSADVELNAAATAEGMAVEDPNAHP